MSLEESIINLIKEVKEELTNFKIETSQKFEALSEKTSQNYNRFDDRLNGIEGAFKTINSRSTDPFFRIFSPPYSYNLNSVSSPEIEFRTPASFYDED